MTFSLKKFIPNSLLARSLLILVSPILLAQIIATYVFFDTHWGGMTRRLAFAVAGEIAIAADQIDNQQVIPDALTLPYTQNLDMLLSFMPDIKIEKQQPVKARFLGRQDIVTTLSEALKKQVHRPYTLDADAHEKWVEVAVQLNDGVLHASIPQRRLFSISGYRFLLWMVGSSFALLTVAVVFMRNQIRPIRRLAAAAELFGKGRDIPPSFRPQGAREVRQAAQAFLSMQERIRRQIDQRTAMLSGVSHDLRTPLTRMKLQVSFLEDCPDVAALKTDIAAMERMIDAYLDFARGEGGEPFSATDVSGMIHRVSDMARRQGAVIEVEASGDLVIQARPVALERCVSNIVQNACKFAKSVKIHAARRGEQVEIIVDDDGPGIPADKREDVFKPFVRLEPSRNAATGGMGLGLSIAQDIVHAHGGEIVLGDSLMGGLRVSVTLPV